MKKNIKQQFKTWQKRKLKAVFYNHHDVLFIARELLGKILVTKFDNIITAGRIVETEAYNGVIDKASHAYGNRRTKRTEVMYASGSTTYVYLCYGIHHLFNVVTNKKGIPHAVLIRAIEPLAGIEDMRIRTGKKKADYTLTKGPGNVSKALGINFLQHTGLRLTGNTIFIADDSYVANIHASKRIGVEYAKEDALLLYRFNIAGNKYVSGNSTGLNIAAMEKERTSE